MLLVAPVVAYYVKVDRSAPDATLSQKDKRLLAEVVGREFKSGSIKNLGTWVKGVTLLTLGTMELEMFTTRDYFQFNTVKSGDLMEAYSTLYRLQWVSYKTGKPHYELTLARDQVDSVYHPQTEGQKQRFAETAQFMHLFDKMNEQDRKAVLSGTPLKYSELPEEMRGAFKRTIGAAIDDTFSPVLPIGKPREKPDIDTLADATISLSDNSKPGSGVREIWISTDTNLGGYSFRWNDYDPKKSKLAFERPASFVQEPETNEKFSRKRMLQRFKKLATEAVTIPEAQWTLAALLEHLSKNYGINFITNEDIAKQTLPFSCVDLPLASALDKISKQYGDWEWEACPGNFVVMRSRESLRRRQPAPGTG